MKGSELCLVYPVANVSLFLYICLHPSGFANPVQLKLFCTDSTSQSQGMRTKGFAPSEQTIQTLEETIECDLESK